MIVTVTPNPSLDRTVELDKLVRGEVLRVRHAHVEPGGKGVNIARALARNGM
ncbi:MAG TPA: 1-phosphofructokinase, partial [Chloroflexota bacterium]|nr:1-phosphofructokinase [Chloroflexota bacterium]